MELVWLEDVREGLGIVDKLYGAVALRFAGSLHRRLGIAASDPAAVLFTSGSEGAPKAVVLSHANLLANRRQIAARVDFSPADLALNALPMFHSFGLTGGFLLPLLSGVRVFLYPSPLHYRIVPEIAYATGATILFGTDTFLAGYARRANPYDFYALRYVFAGAEPVREETRKAWAERFGKRILEGYGVTECSPVIAVNTPMHYRAGTVGRFLAAGRAPARSGRRDRGWRPAVRARARTSWPAICAAAGSKRRPMDGTTPATSSRSMHEGFVAIVGRAKRFAKLGGEMVSLAAAERIAETAMPDDPARGRCAAGPAPRREAGSRHRGARHRPQPADRSGAPSWGCPEIAVPREVLEAEHLPLLGTGKTDYAAVMRLAEQRMASSAVSRRQRSRRYRWLAAEQLESGDVSALGHHHRVSGGRHRQIFRRRAARVHRHDPARHRRRDLRDLVGSAYRLVRTGRRRRVYRCHRRRGLDIAIYRAMVGGPRA